MDWTDTGRFGFQTAILVTITVGVLLDIAIDATIPDRVMNVLFVVVAPVVLLGILMVLLARLGRIAGVSISNL